MGAIRTTRVQRLSGFPLTLQRRGGGLSTGAELKGIPDIKTSGSPSLFRTSLDRPACF